MELDLMRLTSPVGFPVLFGVLWVSISWLLSHIGGWSQLAEYYRYDRPFEGKQWRMQHALMRWRVRYRGTVNVGASSDGLYLSVFPLFRIGHPPLFIPWSDISGAVKKRGLLSGVELRFRRVPTIPFQVTRRLAAQLAQTAGGDWPNSRFENQVRMT